MMLRKLRSEDGVGLLAAVAAAFIVAVAIAGLFMASYITEHKALGVYHYRVALLKGAQKLDEIKCKNRSNTSIEGVNVNGINSGTFTIDEHDNYRVKGTIHPITVDRLCDDNAASPYIKFDKVYVRITWYDGPRLFNYNVLNKQKTIILREDYFYRYETGQ